MSARLWKSLMHKLGIAEHREMYAILIERYSEKHRFYHTFEHIKHCLTLLEENRQLAKRSEEVEIAIWFHDAVYNTFSSNNECESAQMASEFLSLAGCVDSMAKRASDLVMTTLHGTQLSSSDQALMVDIDLSVLGCSSTSYKEFEIAIRKEYKHIPSFIFNRGRKKILNGFLSRERIYTFPEFYQRYETQARGNIKNAINSM